ncbi:MAG: ABC transporter substrate-binding protein, partial [Desulfobacterales bacterium]|nr:ABC transporter substrate-binding protein [Desulfobacterales bacterium]
MMRLLPSLFLYTSLFAAALAGNAQSQTAHGSSPIVLGQSTALSGPAKNLGQEMRAGLLAAFAFINDRGGVKGKEVHLVSLDDGYEPDKAVSNTV